MYSVMIRMIGRVFKSIIALIACQCNDFLDHYHGIKYRAILQDYDNALRSKIKYTDEEGSFKDARDLLWAEVRVHGLSIWD